MKSIFTLLMLATVTSWAQLPVDPETKFFTYQEVVDQVGTKSELYSRAKTWIVETYRDANEVIQLDDQDGGTIIAKGKFGVYLSMNNRYVRHTITIELKDNRYRYTINALLLDWGNGISVEPLETVQPMYRKKLYSQTDEEITSIIARLKRGMAQQKEDW